MKLAIIGFCLMTVSLITAAITLNELFTVLWWLGLLFIVIDIFTD